MQYNEARLALAAGLAGLLVSLLGCSSGSGGSDVGNSDPIGPVAIAAIVGHPNVESDGVVSTTVRGGAEVVLSAGNSYGQDAPILEFDWTPANAAAESVDLITRTSAAKSFTAPRSADPTTLQFELTVTDAHGLQDSAAVEIDVEAATDPDRFLTYLLTPETFDVIASTSEAIVSDKPFVVDVGLRVTYPDRQNLTQVFETVVASQTSTWLASAPPDPADRRAYGNPVLTFELPRLDLDDVNAAYLDLPPGDPGRNRILDISKVDFAFVQVIVSLHFPAGTGGDASKAALFLDDPSGADILARAGVGCEFDGAAQQCVVPLSSFTPDGAENSLSAFAYYQAIDPNFTKTTLTGWLVENCFDPGAEDFGADAHAVYTNNFDLGFGRDMYLKTGANCESGVLPEGDLASVVINYASLLQAGKQVDPIVAVAMEWSPPAGDPAGERFAKFYIFAPDEGSGEWLRITSANFDGRGEKVVPGVCTACHGGRPAPVTFGQPYPNEGNVGAIFMPWDLDSFLFAGPDGDPQKDPSLPPSTQPFLSSVDLEVMDALTRANQEEEFRKLNEAVLATYPQDAHVRKLVHDWYAGGATPDYASNVLSGTFGSGYVPEGWRDSVPGNPVQPSELYLEVIAQHCRACHTQLVKAAPGEPRVPGHTQDIPTFHSYPAFIEEMTDLGGNLTDTIIAPVFDDGVMPLARLTADRLWAPSANGDRPADLLAAHLGLSATRIPGHPTAQILSDKAQYARDDDVRLDGLSASRFADTFAWTLDYEPGSACPNPGDSFVSKAEVVGPTTASPAFHPDVPGDYTVSLTVESAEGRTFEAEPLTLTIPNKCPVAADGLNTSILQGGSDQDFVLSAAGIATSGDAPHTFELVSSANVSVTLDGGVATISCGVGCSQTTPSFFDFRVVDRDGDYDVARVDVTVTTAPTANNITLDLSEGTDGVLANTTTFPTVLETLQVYEATSGGTGERTISVMSPTARGSQVSVLSDGRTVHYEPPLGFIGEDSFTYTVTDATLSDPQSDSAVVTVEVDGAIRFDQDIYSAIFVGKNCATSSCHELPGSTSNNYFDMSGGSAGAVWADAVIELEPTEPPGMLNVGDLFDYPPTSPDHDGFSLAGTPEEWGAPAATCNDSQERRESPYCTILRWKEEGACFLNSDGQPTVCP